MQLVSRTHVLIGAAALVVLGGAAHAQSILVLNGTGVSTVSAPLAAAGFNVVSGTLDPGQIATNLAAHTDVVQIWVWNDGTYGNSYSPADPLRDFDANDLAALDAFRATHPHWILDCLAWRPHTSLDEQNLTKNEALALAAAGGGIVLGTDDDSGAAIVQHVNQVAAHVGLSPFVGTYLSLPGMQYAAGTFFSAPHVVDPNGLLGSGSYCDAPAGLQPNGLFLATALYGAPSASLPAFPSPPLASEYLNGALQADVDHLITTTIPGASFDATKILVLNGIAASTVAAPLAAAGFDVLEGTLDPGQISGALATHPDIDQIWIWNDGTYGNTGTPADPLRDFDAGDLAALDAFRTTHPHWILDGFAWRSHTNPDDVNLTTNEAFALAAAGGGIVLGADDDSGGAIVQHVNQIAAHVGFDAWGGTHFCQPPQQLGGGTLLATPTSVLPAGLISTVSYSQVPHGLQPNGTDLETVVLGTQVVGLGDEVVGGALYGEVLHLVTTSIPGAGLGTGRVAVFCSGDGSATGCPCGNAGLSGAGCDNSVGTGGAFLATSGVASVAADSFQLDGSNMPASATALYFQGTVATNGAQGVPFGDGLRCVGGTVVRLAIRTNVAGASGYGAPLGDVPVSQRGFVPVGGGTFFYQAWYRDTGVFCTPSGFNLTNGVAVTWTP